MVWSVQSAIAIFVPAAVSLVFVLSASVVVTGALVALLLFGMLGGWLIEELGGF